MTTAAAKLPKRTRFVMAALIVCGVVILVTTGFILIQIIRIQIARVGDAVKTEPVEETHPPVVLSTVPPFTQSYELPGMSISLANRNQTLAAYAEFDLVLDCPNKESRAWMALNRASIRDAVFESTVAFTVEDFSTPEGFGRIKKAILQTLKERFGERAPRDAVIRDWVIR